MLTRPQHLKAEAQILLELGPPLSQEEELLASADLRLPRRELMGDVAVYSVNLNQMCHMLQRLKVTRTSTRRRHSILPAIQALSNVPLAVDVFDSAIELKFPIVRIAKEICYVAIELKPRSIVVVLIRTDDLMGATPRGDNFGLRETAIPVVGMLTVPMERTEGIRVRAANSAGQSSGLGPPVTSDIALFGFGMLIRPGRSVETCE